MSLQAFPVTDLISQIGVDFLLRPLTSDSLPADAYGIHLDLSLPDSPGFGFVNSPGPGAIVFDGNVFGIGPGIVADFVPEGGNTIALIALALTVLIAAKSCLRNS